MVNGKAVVVAGWYCNITLNGARQDKVVKLLNQLHRKAIVSPVERTYLTVYPAQWRYSSLAVAGQEGGDDVDKVEQYVWWQQLAPYDPEMLAEELTTRLKCSALVIENMDGSEFYYALFNRGKLLDRYLAPGVHGGEEFDFSLNDYPPPTLVPAYGGNAALLCQYFGSPEATEVVAAILRQPDSDWHEQLDARERHQLLVQAHVLPEFTHYQYPALSPSLPPGFRFTGS